MKQIRWLLVLGFVFFAASLPGQDTPSNTPTASPTISPRTPTVIPG